MIEYAKSYAKKAEFIQMDIRELKFEDNFFNGIWSVTSLLHLPKNEIPKALGEAYRVLKRNGIMYVCVKEGHGEELKPDLRYSKDAIKFYSYFKKDEIEKFLTWSGFSLLESRMADMGVKYLKEPQFKIFAIKK